jgi:hypothetical protein
MKIIVKYYYYELYLKQFSSRTSFKLEMSLSSEEIKNLKCGFASGGKALSISVIR